MTATKKSSTKTIRAVQKRLNQPLQETTPQLQSQIPPPYSLRDERFGDHGVDAASAVSVIAVGPYAGDQGARAASGGLSSAESSTVQVSVAAEQTRVSEVTGNEIPSIYDTGRIYTPWWSNDDTQSDAAPHTSTIKRDPVSLTVDHNSASTNNASGAVTATSDKSALNERAPRAKEARASNDNSVKTAAVAVSSTGADNTSVNLNTVRHVHP